MTLTEFLLARIAEDKAVAEGALDDQGQTWVVVPDFDGPAVNAPGADGRADVVVYAEAGAPTAGAAEHIARHDPARVLAECEAKRRIVERCQPLLRHLDAPPSATTAWDLMDTLHGSTLHDLASVYADHPDYDEEWKP